MGVGTFGREVNDNGRSARLAVVLQRHARRRRERPLVVQGLGRRARPGRAAAARRAPSPTRRTRRTRRFANSGTRQPKFDTRVDYEAPEGAYRLSFSGGFAGTEGIIHTGIGPFDMNRGTMLGYGSARWTKGAQKLNFFTNILNGDANALLSFGLDGQPILFNFNTKTFDARIRQRHGVRHPQRRQLRRQLPLQPASTCRLAPARRQPLGRRRLHPGRDLHQRLPALGGRRPPRQVQRARRPELLAAHRAHHQAGAGSRRCGCSFNRAFRAPSLINNFLDVEHRQPARPARHQPGLSPVAPGGPVYNFPVAAVGNEDLVEQQVDAFEVAYTGVDRQARDGHGRLLLQQVEGRHLLHADRPLPRRQPAARLADQAAPLVGDRPRAGILEVLPPPCTSATAACNGAACRRTFTYLQPRHGARQGHRARRRRGGQPRAERLCQLLLPVQARSRLRHLGSQPAADQPRQRRLQLQPGHVPRQHERQLPGRGVLAGRARRALPRLDRGLHAGQRRLRRAVDRPTRSRPRSSSTTCSTRKSSRTSSATSCGGR